MNLVWRRLTPGTGGLCVPGLVELHRARVEQFSRSDLHGSFQGCLQPSRGWRYPRAGGGNWLLFSSALRTLLRKAGQPTCRVGMLENKNPDIFQTFDPIAFSAWVFYVEDFWQLGVLFPLKIFLRDKKRKITWLHTKCKMSSGVHFENRLPAETLFSLSYWAFVFQCYASCNSSGHNMGKKIWDFWRCSFCSSGGSHLATQTWLSGCWFSLSQPNDVLYLEQIPWTLPQGSLLCIAMHVLVKTFSNLGVWGPAVIGALFKKVFQILTHECFVGILKYRAELLAWKIVYVCNLKLFICSQNKVLTLQRVALSEAHQKSNAEYREQSFLRKECFRDVLEMFL